MKKNKFLRKLTVLFLFISFFSACNKTNDMEPLKEESTTISSNNGFQYSLEKLNKSSNKANINGNVKIRSSDEYLLTVTDSLTGKSKKAFLVKEYIDENLNNYDLSHYDENNNRIATLLIRDSKIKDIVINEYTHQSNGLKASSPKAASQDCFTRGYKQYKEFYSQGDWKEIACDIGNLFAGACTIGGVISGAINCILGR